MIEEGPTKGTTFNFLRCAIATKVDREIDIDALTFYPLNKHTSPEDISGYLKPLVG